MRTKQDAVVQTPRFSDQIYHLLREELCRGTIAPGTRIIETQLAGRFGVSRTPVREALIQLRREDFIAGGNARHTVAIAAVSNSEDNPQRDEARCVVEQALAEAAARRAGMAHRRALTQAYEAARAAHHRAESHAFARASSRFRALLRGMADNDVLAHFATTLDESHTAALDRRFDKAELRARDLARLSVLLEAAQCNLAVAPITVNQSA